MVIICSSDMQLHSVFNTRIGNKDSLGIEGSYICPLCDCFASENVEIMGRFLIKFLKAI